MPVPGCGLLLAFILNILDGYKLTSNNVMDTKSTVLTYHRVIEAFKFAYAKRTEFGDTNFINIDKVNPMYPCVSNNFIISPILNCEYLNVFLAD